MTRAISEINIICGPTSSGKTTLALKLCKESGGEIISADSRQIYKHMDIGTGKQPLGYTGNIDRTDEKWTFNDIPVWGYDLVSPDQFFSGYDFALFAIKTAQDIINRGKKVYLVGGTGFYIDLFTGRVKPSNIAPDLKLRAEMADKPLEELLALLSQSELATIDTKNPARVMRAVEKKLATKINPINLPYLENVSYKYTLLLPPRAELYQKADSWVDAIWANGFTKEVEKLIDLGYKDSPKLHGLVYKSGLDFLEGKLTREEAIQRAKFDVHAYIRRQETYFNGAGLMPRQQV